MDKIHENELMMLTVKTYKKVENEFKSYIDQKYGNDPSDQKDQKNEDLKYLTFELVRIMMMNLIPEETEKV